MTYATQGALSSNTLGALQLELLPSWKRTPHKAPLAMCRSSPHHALPHSTPARQHMTTLKSENAAAPSAVLGIVER